MLPVLWVKVNAPRLGFQYEECTVAGIAERPAVSNRSLSQERSGELGPFAFTPTNLSSALTGTVTINNHTPEQGDIIAAFDEAGNCVGAARLVIRNGGAYFSLPIYGDDKTTPSLDEGMNAGESYHLKLFEVSDGDVLEHGVELAGWVNTNGAPLSSGSDPDVFNLASSARVVGQVPDDYSLSQNYPNPFNPTTTIRFGLPVTSQVELSVYNIVGQKVATLVNGDFQAGLHEVEWQGVDETGVPVASGVYFYRLTTDAYNETKKMLLLK